MRAVLRDPTARFPVVVYALVGKARADRLQAVPEVLPRTAVKR
jgi:hypothetical protein